MTAEKTARSTTYEELGNPEQREILRRQMEQDVEAFLNSGGRVEEVECGHRADPPRKPKSQYGTRPI